MGGCLGPKSVLGHSNPRLWGGCPVLASAHCPQLFMIRIGRAHAAHILDGCSGPTQVPKKTIFLPLPTKSSGQEGLACRPTRCHRRMWILRGIRGCFQAPDDKTCHQLLAQGLGRAGLGLSVPSSKSHPYLFCSSTGLLGKEKG